MDELSRREREVLALAVTGLRNKQIAAELYVGAETVKTHLSNIYKKLEVSGRGEAIAKVLAGRAERPFAESRP